MAINENSLVKNIQIKQTDDSYSGYNIYATESKHAVSADTATSAETAGIAEKAKALIFDETDSEGNVQEVTNIGSDTQPVYLKDGVLTACTQSLGVVKAVGDGLSITEDGELNNIVKTIGDGLSLNEETGELSSNIKAIGDGLSLNSSGTLSSVVQQLSDVYDTIETKNDVVGASAYAVQKTYDSIPSLTVVNKEDFDEDAVADDTSTIYFVMDAYTEANVAADSIGYDNTTSKMTSDTVQAAIDELKTSLSATQTMVSGLSEDIDDLSDEIDDKQNTITIDTALSTTSENPVQNKVIQNAIQGLSDKIDNKQDSITIDTALSTTSTNPVQNKVIQSAIQNIWDTMFPVGSIYSETQKVNPSAKFGGYWGIKNYSTAGGDIIINTFGRNIIYNWERVASNNLSGVCILGPNVINITEAMSYPSNTTYKYTVEYVPATVASSSQGVTWELEYGASYASIDSSTGVLTIKSLSYGTSAGQIIIIRATSTVDTSISATKLIYLWDYELTLG